MTTVALLTMMSTMMLMLIMMMMTVMRMAMMMTTTTATTTMMMMMITMTMAIAMKRWRIRMKHLSAPACLAVLCVVQSLQGCEPGVLCSFPSQTAYRADQADWADSED
jgi:hypothetical protein